MKIGIMTFWWSEDNYGQQLQCFALQRYLRNGGHDAFLVRYDPRSDYTKYTFLEKIQKAINPRLVIKYISSKLRIVLSNRENMASPRCFADFRKKYLNQTESIYYSYAELQANTPEADLYIVGSDQVWNFQNMPLRKCINLVNAYFLNFGDNCEYRFSYAASFNQEKLSEEYIPVISKSLERFTSVSVREKSGLDICISCGVNNAEWDADPSFLLDSESYRILYSENEIRKPQRPYVLIYLLGNKCDFSVAKAYVWADSKGLDVQYVTGNMMHDLYKKNNATIAEWLYLVDNAEFVITNSFHCCVFSYIFNTQFAVIPLVGKKNDSANLRLMSLFDMLGDSVRFIVSNNFLILEDCINFSSINSRINMIRKSDKLITKINQIKKL